VARFLPRVESKLLDQGSFGSRVPLAAKRGEIGQRVLHGHPWIERDRIGDVRNARFHRNVVANGIEPEDPGLAARWTKQVQQTLDRRGLPRAVPTEEAVTAARGNAQVEAVNRIGPAEAPNQILNVDCGCVFSHGLSHMRGTRSLLFECVESFFAKAQELALVDLKMMRVHHGFVD
jgi:hypothetical protein